MTMHEEWTDKLSEYLDGELSPADTAAVDAHLRGCAACRAILEELRRVVARAQALPYRPPDAELWSGIAGRIERLQQARRFTFTLPQLAAAAVLLIAVSAGVAWKVAEQAAQSRMPTTSTASPIADAARPVDSGAAGGDARGGAPAADVAGRDASAEPAVMPISLGDAQYDAAVTDLEKAVRQGRGRLDAATIAIVEHNLQIIDQAIAQAREALAADPANTYLTSHLVEARRRKLDLLRRAAALAETD